MNFSIIVACTDEGIIGVNNTIPWYIPDDLKYFKTITTGNEKNKNIVIMGRNTWESLPTQYKPLKDRINIIISNTLILDKKLDNVYVYKSLDEFFNNVKRFDYNEIFLIGGGQLYKTGLEEPYKSLCNKIYMTKIKLPISIQQINPSNTEIVTFPIDKLTEYKLTNKSTAYNYKDIEYNYEIYTKSQ